MNPMRVIEPTPERILEWGATLCAAAEDEAWTAVGRTTRNVRQEFKDALDAGQAHAAVAMHEGSPVAIWVLRATSPQPRALECLGGAIEPSLTRREKACACFSILGYVLRRARARGIQRTQGDLAASRPLVREVFEAAGLEVVPTGRDPETGEVRIYHVIMHFDDATEAKIAAALEAL